MNLFRSILLLVSLCLFIMLPYSFGYGLATHTAKPFIVGIICGALSFGMFFLQSKDSGSTH